MIRQAIRGAGYAVVVGLMVAAGLFLVTVAVLAMWNPPP